MGKKKKLRKTLSNPSLLAPFNEKGGILQVVIETPKGSRNKYAFDQEQKVFALKKVLPAGMAFPYDFGFVPSTVAEGLRRSIRSSFARAIQISSIAPLYARTMPSAQ